MDLSKKIQEFVIRLVKFEVPKTCLKELDFSHFVKFFGSMWDYVADSKDARLLSEA